MRIVPIFLFFSFTILHAQKMDTSRLDEVAIRAIRTNQRMTTSGSTISRKDIEHINLGQDIPTMFQILPSTSSGSDAGNGIGYSYLNIRGLDAQRIQVNINGVPYNDAESHEVYWVNIPDIMNNADDIEVQRGVGYSTMGGSGLGGTISIKTTKRYTSPMLSLSLNTGSFNTFRSSVMASTGVLPQGWQVTARGSRITSDGFIDRASSNLTSFYSNISKYGDRYSTHLIATHGRERTYQSWFGLSESDFNSGLLTKNIAGTDYEQKAGDPYPNQVDNYGQSHLQWLNNFNWNGRNSSSFSAFLSHGRGFYEEYRVGQDFTSYNSQLSGSGDLVRRLWLDNILLGANASHIIEGKQWTNTSSLSFSHYTGNHFGTLAELLADYSGTIPNEYYSNQGLKTDFSVFNKFNFEIKKSNFTIDLQLRKVGYEVQGKDASNQELHIQQDLLFFNPKLGWNTELAKTSKVYGFLGINHREPNRNDMLTADLKNQPKPERVINFELGQRSSIKNLMFSSNFFMMYFQDQLIPTGALNSVGAPIRQNVSKSYRTGLELELEYRFSKKWKLYTNQYLAVNAIKDYQNITPTYNSDFSINADLTEIQNFSSTTIANSPSWISFGSLQYKPWKNTSLELMNKIVGSQYLDNTESELRSLPLYSFTNFSINHSLFLKNGVKEIKLQLLLNNIFNSNFIPRGYTYGSGNMVNPDNTITPSTNYSFYYPQAGFNILTGVQFKF